MSSWKIPNTLGVHSIEASAKNLILLQSFDKSTESQLNFKQYGDINMYSVQCSVHHIEYIICFLVNGKVVQCCKI